MKLTMLLLLLLTIKFSSAQPINYWGTGNSGIKYNNYNNGLDKAISVTSDSHCFIYVTGVSEAIGTGLDYLTIKYDIYGDTVWTRRYDGNAGGGDDIPAAIKVDNNGNVYVTGKSMGSGTGFDWATIKYNSNGDTLWVRRFNNTKAGGNGDDVAVKLYVDASGQNVYVGGSSYDYVSSNTLNDYLVIRYNSANGNSVWGNPNVSGYTTASDFVYYDDVLSDMIVDGSGNVYVTGSSYGANSNVRQWHTVAFDNTGKYKGNKEEGSFNFGNRYPTSIALDGSGNVFVFGTMDGNLTIARYNSQLYSNPGLSYYGLQASGPFQYSNKSSEIKYSSGYLYFTGNLDYDGSTATDYDIITAKINSSTMDTVWVKRYGNSGKDDCVSSLALDATSNLYLTGYTTNSNGHKEIIIQKYTSAGKTVSGYPLTYNDGNTTLDHEGNQILITPESNILVTGYSTGTTSQEDFVTFKYVNFIPTANAGIDKEGCSASSIVIGTTPTSGYTYLWKPSSWLSDSTKSNPSVSDTISSIFKTNYYLTVRSGCAENTDTVAVTINTLPQVPVIKISNDTILSNITTPLYTYQWFKSSNSIPGATNTLFTGASSGNYYLQVTNTNGCISVSNTVNYSITGTNAIDTKSEFLIYPNPNKGKFEISMNSDVKDDYYIEIFNIIGLKIIPTQKLINSSHQNYDLSYLPSGIYLIHLRNQKTETIENVIIEK